MTLVLIKYKKKKNLIRYNTFMFGQNSNFQCPSWLTQCINMRYVPVDWKLIMLFSLCFFILGDRDNSLNVLSTELKNQKKLVKSLKKKSLWSRTMDEVVFLFSFCRIYVQFIHQLSPSRWRHSSLSRLEMHW